EVLTHYSDLRKLSPKKSKAGCGRQKTNFYHSDIEVEEEEKYRIEGPITVSGGSSLGGKIELGVSPAYLEWLPHPEEVFPRKSAGYLWTTIHLSGTLESPQQDLSPRLVEALQGSPS